MRLRWHIPICYVLCNHIPTSIGFTRISVLSIFIKVKWFAYSMGNVLSRFWLLWHAVIRMSIWWNSQIWAIWSLDLKLLINARIVLCLVSCHASLSWSSGRCSHISLLLLLLILLNTVAIINVLQILSAISGRRWLEKEIVLKLLGLICLCLGSTSRSVVNCCVICSLLTIFILLIIWHFFLIVILIS